MVKMRPRTLGLALIAVAILSPGLAQADDAEEAKQAFMTASRFFQAEEYEAALPLFQRAYKLSEHRPATIFGLAQCERSLKAYRESMTHFREYLATGPDNAEDVQQTIRLLTDLIKVQDDAEARRQKEQAELEAERSAKQAAQAEAQRVALRAEAERLMQEAEARRAAERAEQAQREAAAEAERQERAAAAAPDLQLAPPDAPVAPEAQQEQVQLTAPTQDAPEESEGGVLSSPWFWVITSVVVVGGAVASGVVLARGTGDNVYGGTSDVVLGN